MTAAPDILANISRCWKRDPIGVGVGSGHTGISAALWSRDDADVEEVWAEPDPTRHIVSVPQVTFASEMWFDGRVAWAGPADAGGCTIVSAGRAPRAVNTGSYSILHMYVPTTLLSDVASTDERAGDARDITLVDPACAQDIAIAGIGRRMIEEMRDRKPLSRLRIDVLGQELAIHLLRRHSSLSGTPAFSRHPDRGGLAPWQLRRVAERLEDELDADIALETLAREVGLSEAHLCRAFKVSTGLPPHRWRAERRMARAKALLAGTRMSIIEVALAVGYASQTTFGEAFRRVTGDTPAQFRRDRPTR